MPFMGKRMEKEPLLYDYLLLLMIKTRTKVQYFSQNITVIIPAQYKYSVL